MIKEILATLRANKLRSLLTMFGISWGIMSFVLMTAMGEGFRVAQRESTKMLGKDIMIIWSGRTSVQSEDSQEGRQIRLKYSDYEAIRDRCRLIRSASPEIIRSDIVSKTHINNGTFGIHGILPPYQYMRTLEVQWGRPLNWADDEGARQVCVVGSEVNDQLFQGTNSIGQTLSIGGHPFTVTGAMSYKQQNSSYSGQDRRKIFIPFHTMTKLFSDPSLGQSRDLIDDIIAMPVQASVHREAEMEVRKVIGKVRGFDYRDEDALSIWNTALGAQMIDSIIRSMQWFLGTVGVVTLVLGGIGVVNIMLVTVRERTMEIGVRKSVGAKRRDILRQFFLESFALTAVSGLSGLGLGWGICQLVNRLPMPKEIFAGMMIAPEIGAWAAVALVVVGIMAGVYPAYVAAELDPIEALRASE